jgi:hypothetical protein
MAGYQYTPAEYALQHVVECFGILFSELAEQNVTHTSVVVFLFCHIENINYLVLRYLDTGALPFEEFSKVWLHNGEI